MPRFLLCKYSAHSFRAGVFPSSQRRGGRDIKRYREASFEERTGWSLTSHISECVLNTACERRRFLMAAPYYLRFRAIALTLRAGLRGLRPPSAPLRRLRDIFLLAQPPLLREEGCSRPNNFGCVANPRPNYRRYRLT